jgi:putative cell wall-binding protein
MAQVQTNVYASISAKSFTISPAVAAKFAGISVAPSDDLGKQLIALANASAKASSIESSSMQLSNINGISHGIRTGIGSYTVTFTSAEGLSKTVVVKVDSAATAKEESIASDKSDETIDTSSSSSVDTDRTADGSKTETATTVNDATVNRLYGANRYDTALAIAEKVLEASQKSQHKSIIVANGNNFQEALVGSYLSKSLANTEGQYAPILLVANSDAVQTKVANYIKQNLKEGGTVYLLGGESLVSSSFANLLSGLNVKRIAGNNSYAINLAILKAAAVPAGSEVVIASGDSYADNLSASASGKPIILAKNSGLTADQIEYLKSISPSRIIIMGGTGAVSAQVASQLAQNFAGTEVKRLAGANRYETSKLAALEFFGDGVSRMNAASVTLAYGLNFADGLGGGIIAMVTGGPLVLVGNTSSATTASQWINASGSAISTVNVLGGSSLITDDMVRIIVGS